MKKFEKKVVVDEGKAVVTEKVVKEMDGAAGKVIEGAALDEGVVELDGEVLESGELDYEETDDVEMMDFVGAIYVELIEMNKALREILRCAQNDKAKGLNDKAKEQDGKAKSCNDKALGCNGGNGCGYKAECKELRLKVGVSDGGGKGNIFGKVFGNLR